MPGTKGGRVIGWGNRVTGWLAAIGAVRVFDLGATIGRGLPDRQANEMRAILNQPGSWSTSGRVLGLWDERTRPAVNGARPLGHLPLAVLGVTEQPRVGEQLTALQAELPGLSTNSFRRIVEGATHESLVAKREHALVVVEAIRRVIALAAQDASSAPPPRTP
jgi:hypothetical protein